MTEEIKLLDQQRVGLIVAITRSAKQGVSHVGVTYRACEIEQPAPGTVRSGA